MFFTHCGTEYYVDDEIHFKQVIGHPDLLILTKDFHCFGDIIKAGFVWDGASSPSSILCRWIAPKFHKNLVASCWHDYRCGLAKNKAERKMADDGYYILKKYVESEKTLKTKLSYLGTRIGAMVGIGNNFDNKEKK